MIKIRKNVLKSFLFVCLGLALTTIVFANARAFVSPPDPPEMPMIVDLWATGCMIEYKAPEYDGGLPLKDYIIECKVKGKKSWEVLRSTPELKYRVTGMKTGSEAQFRVIAQNDAGRSEPSKPSFPVKFQNRSY